jgi:hypothetical protein
MTIRLSVMFSTVFFSPLFSSFLLFIFNPYSFGFSHLSALIHPLSPTVLIPVINGNFQLEFLRLIDYCDYAFFTSYIPPFLLFLLIAHHHLEFLFILFIFRFRPHVISNFYCALGHIAQLRKRVTLTGLFSPSDRLTLLLTISLFSSTTSERIALPRVHGINPPCGPKNGGTAVSIHGENFVRTKTFCRFGDLGLPISPTLVTSSLVLCKSPPTSYINPSRVRLQVTNDGGYTYSSDRISFYYSGGCSGSHCKGHDSLFYIFILQSSRSSTEYSHRMEQISDLQLCVFMATDLSILLFCLVFLDQSQYLQFGCRLT